MTKAERQATGRLRMALHLAASDTAQLLGELRRAKRERPGAGFAEGPDAKLAERLDPVLARWWAALAEASDALSAFPASLTDDAGEPPLKRWTVRVRDDIRQLREDNFTYWIMAHPVGNAGGDAPGLRVLGQVRQFGVPERWADIAERLIGYRDVLKTLLDAGATVRGEAVKPKPLSAKECQRRVSECIRQKESSGASIHDITRDGIATATGVAAGRVSGTNAWRALAARRKQETDGRRVNRADAGIDAAIQRGDAPKREALREALQAAAERGDWDRYKELQKQEAKLKPTPHD